ncbi:MAG: hypothetical protein F6J92_32180 [Symploca sp. SIO1A3]|nr:hypothetical protein [Symploca sp. SIO1A3]
MTDKASEDCLFREQQKRDILACCFFGLTLYCTRSRLRGKYTKIISFYSSKQIPWVDSDGIVINLGFEALKSLKTGKTTATNTTEMEKATIATVINTKIKKTEIVFSKAV